MIYIGTDQGIFRWFHGAPWPIFHSLQDRRIVSLATAGGGLMAALDGEGRLWETTTNGLDWRVLPRPDSMGRPTALSLVGGTKPSWLLATASPLEMHARRIGLQVEEEEAPRRARLKKVRSMLSFEGTAATATRRKAKVVAWRPLATPTLDLKYALNGMRWVQTSGTDEAWFASIIQGGLWRSDDQGATWTGCELGASDVMALRRDGSTLAAATDAGVWMSTDGGSSWSERSAGLEKARHVTAIEIKPGNPKQLLAGCADTTGGKGPERCALFESKDGGQIWKQVTRGFPVDLESDAIVDVRYDPANLQFAALALGSGELWKTFTDGFWWEPLARQIHRARVLCAVA